LDPEHGARGSPAGPAVRARYRPADAGPRCAGAQIAGLAGWLLSQSSPALERYLALRQGCARNQLTSGGIMRALTFALALLAAGPAEAATLLHPMFADHAVLQRGQPIPVYGTAKPGADVTLQLGSATVSAHADKDGQWRTTLPAMPAGGPYVLHAASGGETQDVRDVLVGDVFLCTGQSNMALSVRGAANATAEIAAATDTDVRELAVDRVPSPVELTSFKTPVSWKVESPQTAGDFSASCFYFARELRK